MLSDMENTLRVRRAEKSDGGRMLSQRKVAIGARIAFNRYWRIELDYVDPTPQEIKALARYFRCDAAVLFPSLATTTSTNGALA